MTGGGAAVSGLFDRAQMRVEKNLGTASSLRQMMPGLGAPAHQRLFVAPDRQRQQPAGTREAAVADVVGKPVDTLELRLEHPAEAQIAVPLLGLRMHLEDHGKHAHLHSAHCEERLRRSNSNLLVLASGLLRWSSGGAWPDPLARNDATTRLFYHGCRDVY